MSPDIYIYYTYIYHVPTRLKFTLFFLGGTVQLIRDINLEQVTEPVCSSMSSPEPTDGAADGETRRSLRAQAYWCRVYVSPETN